MSYLVDTNVISELRKKDRADPAVTSWFAGLKEDEIYLSVLTVGEIRRGITNVARRDPPAASNLNQWLARIVMGFDGRIIPIDTTIAQEWGRMNSPDPLPTIDGLLAATARIRGMTLATRNVRDVARAMVEVVDPFA